MHPQRRSEVRMQDCTLIARPPGNPFAIKVFTDAIRADARLHAAQHGAAVETRPLP